MYFEPLTLNSDPKNNRDPQLLQQPVKLMQRFSYYGVEIDKNTNYHANFDFYG